MSYRTNRKVTPKVVDGKAQKKHRHDVSPCIWTSDEFLFEKERPGPGYRHILSKDEFVAFLEIVPEWQELSRGLKGIRMEKGGSSGHDGLYFHKGLICVPAWERDLWREAEDWFAQEHRAFFNRIGLVYEKTGHFWTLKHTIETARAYLLLHVFLHELGHHNDRMTSRNKANCGRGEHYAENWAYEYERKVWDDYQALFGPLP